MSGCGLMLGRFIAIAEVRVRFPVVELSASFSSRGVKGAFVRLTLTSCWHVGETRSGMVNVVGGRGVCGLVVEYLVAIEVTRVRFPADALPSCTLTLQTRHFSRCPARCKGST